jgi:cold-inducible RNA-binding protein
VKKLFVGNLPFSASEEDVRGMFQEFGEVQGVTIPTDRDTGKPRGFAFVEMSADDDAEKAIAALNGKSLGGRTLNVNEARPKESRGPGGGGHDRGGRGGRHGGGGGYR